METRGQVRVSRAAAVALLAVLSTAVLADEAQRAPWPTADRPAWPSSRFHGAIDGNGAAIPCRCRFGGHSYRLGELVCMATPAGVVLARCDLMLNNTSWVPTSTPCTMSRAWSPVSVSLALDSIAGPVSR